MPSKTVGRKTKKTSSAPKTPVLNTASLRAQLESMRELHAVVLVVMVSLVAGMLMILARQKREIDQLKFQVNFIEQRYTVWRDKGMREIEAKLPPSPSASPLGRQ